MAGRVYRKIAVFIVLLLLRFRVLMTMMCGFYVACVPLKLFGLGVHYQIYS